MRRLNRALPVLLMVCALAALYLTGCGAGSNSLPEHIPTQAGLSSLPIPATRTPSPGVDAPAPNPTLSIPLPTPFPDSPSLSIGQSVEGRDITAWQFGDGPLVLILVGGIHAGYEANTVWLSNLLIQYFQKNPTDVLPGIRLIIVPLANPDGIMRGDGLAGRLNARGVDLNRNWGCDWSAQAYLDKTPVDPGPRPFSEPESLALRSFFIEQKPSAVLFFHSAIGGIFLGACRGRSPGVDWMGALLHKATGYPYEKTFAYYDVSGDATNWLAERGVPSAVIELKTKDQPEMRQNLNGVIALQCHLALESQPDAGQQPAFQRLCAP